MAKGRTHRASVHGSCTLTTKLLKHICKIEFLIMDDYVAIPADVTATIISEYKGIES